LPDHFGENYNKTKTQTPNQMFRKKVHNFTLVIYTIHMTSFDVLSNWTGR